jgi:hypothetical protein
MRSTIPFITTTTGTAGHRIHIIATLLISLLLALALSACPAPEIGVPTVIPARPCVLSPGESIPLTVTGVQGDVIYEWSPSAGVVTPPTGPAVTYKAPNDTGQVIIAVTAKKDGKSSMGSIICMVEATPTPSPTVTNTPTPTDTPVPTNTPTPTDTPVPTNTPIPTDTLVPTDTPIPTDTPTLTPTPPPLECRHPELTAYVFPQLQEVPGQRAFYGPLEESEEVFLCEGVRDIVHSIPVAVRIEYHIAQGTGRFGYFGIGTLGGYNVTQFSQICLWAYAVQPDQAFRVKLRDTLGTEMGVNVTVRDANEWSRICVDLQRFSDQGVDLSQLDNINLGFEEANGSATVWVDDFELVK